MSAQKSPRLVSERPDASVRAVYAGLEGMAKGVNFLNVQAFADARFCGDGGWAAVVASVGEDDRAVVEGTLAIGWYPLPLYARLLRALDAKHGRGDLAAAH